MKIYILQIILLFSLLNCTQKKENKTQKDNQIINELTENKVKNTIDISMIKKYIKLQSTYWCDDPIEVIQHTYSKTDLELTLPIIDSILTLNSYIKPNDEEFRKIIKDAFTVDIKESTDEIFIIRCDDFIDRQLIDNDYELCISHLFVDTKRKFITPMIPLKDLVDIDSNDKINYKNNLSIIVFNRFLFNNNKAGLIHLIENDKEFSKRLLTSFRYDKIDMLNRNVITNFENKYNAGGLIFNKDRKGNLRISKRVLNTFKNWYKEELENDEYNANKVIVPLAQYAENLIKNNEIFNEHEIYEIFAYLSDLHDFIHKKDSKSYSWNYSPILLKLKNSVDESKWLEIKAYYIKNNYFNLSNLKSVIEYTENYQFYQLE